MKCSIASLSLAYLLLMACVALAENNFTPEQLEFFEKQVRPILVKRCYECHSEQSKEPKGGLRVDSRQHLLTGGETGAALVPGNAKESLLIDAINYGETYQMPPKTKMPADEIAVLTKWVTDGAAWPASPETSVTKEKFDIAKRKAERWCWQPLQSPAVPVVTDKNWPIDPLDNFILAGLEKQKFQPNPSADKRVLLRRLYFDLIGLPPTPEQVQAFVNNESPAAWNNLVNDLLNSPQFGEKWGRHWLDLMRYAESRGHEFDYNTANPQHYRDYVIRAFNDNLPYNQLVIEHVAGDLLENPRRKDNRNESILGTGFWFLGEWVHSPVDIRKDEADRYDNMVDVFSKSFLGLTVACARCHDHKFDAISQQDYYALFGYLQSSCYRLARFDTMLQEEQQAASLAKLNQEYAAELAKQTALSLQNSINDLPNYLVAAEKVFQQFPTLKYISQAAPRSAKKKPDLKSETPPQFSAEELKFMETLCLELKLDSGRLQAWVTTLLQEETQPGSLWIDWTKMARSKHPLETLKQLEKQAIDRHNQRTTAVPQVEKVYDFGEISPANYMRNGVTFGLSPNKCGELIYSNDDTIVSDVATLSGARRDPTWNILRAAPGTQQDVGKLGECDRAGKTIRTASFTLKQGKIHYLVKGLGDCYAVVDSHAVLHGPLHGQLLLHFTQGASHLRWITQDLNDYTGHRLHLEFSPVGHEPLEVYSVWQGPQPPFPVPEIGENALGKVLYGLKPQTASGAGDQFRLAFKEANESLAANTLAKYSDRTALVSFMLVHEDLFPRNIAESKSVAEYIQKRQAITSTIEPESRYCMAMWDGSGEDELLMIRGNPRLTGSTVPRRLPEALIGNQVKAIPHGSGRLEMAQALVNVQVSPFTPRVMVNRVWHHLMGRGLVPSVDNFGVLGSEPTHAELLDFLASRFVAENWSVKDLIRHVVTSRTYQMASTLGDGPSENADPNNLLWRRTQIKRLTAEAVRDNILSVSGRLNSEMYGASVPVFLTDFLQGRGRPGTGPLDGNGRRSIYLGVRRNFLSPMLLAFDAPSPFSTMGQRNVSNVPAQALILMNDPFVLQQAEIWSKKIIATPNLTMEQRISHMYETAFNRPPTSEELVNAQAFLETQTKAYEATTNPMTDPRPWTDLAHVLFNVKEFIFIP